MIGPGTRIYQQAAMAIEAEQQGKRTVILCGTVERADQIRRVLDLGDRPLIHILVVNDLPRFLTEPRFVAFVSVDDPRAVSFEDFNVGAC